MKSYAIVQFCLALGFAHAAPRPGPEPAASTVTVYPVPAGTPYPQPTTNEFKYLHYDRSKEEDKIKQYTVHAAFIPYSDILSAALNAVGNTGDDTIWRWFPKTVKRDKEPKSIDARVYVGNVIRRMFQAPDVPHPRIASFFNDKNEINGRNTCATGKNTKAYTVNDNAYSVFTVCPAGYALPMIADAKNCSSLGDKVSKKMQSLSATEIHEITHYNEIGDKVDNTVGHITDVIYGPSNCFRMAHAPSDKNNQKTFVNADSYKWFAINAYYNKVCKKEFKDPDIDDSAEFKAWNQELKESPEYSPELNSGALEGI